MPCEVVKLVSWTSTLIVPHNFIISLLEVMFAAHRKSVTGGRLHTSTVRQFKKLQNHKFIAFYTDCAPDSITICRNNRFTDGPRFASLNKISSGSTLQAFKISNSTSSRYISLLFFKLLQVNVEEQTVWKYLHHNHH